ncbi:DUF748 domain-containing protein, partial [bacterium]|nr:DUF748 domain-containing protein [bacterium]
MGIAEKARRLKGSCLSKKLLISFVCAVIFYSLAGFFVLPPVLKRVIEKKASGDLNRTVIIKKIQFNPYILSFTIHDLMVQNPEGSEPFIFSGKINIDFEAASLPKLAVIVKTLAVERPYIKIVRKKDLSYNFSDILKGKDNNSPGSRHFLFSLNNIRISEGAFEFVDIPRNMHHHIDKLNLAVPFISNMAHHIENYVQPSLSAVINGTPVSFSGKTKPFGKSLETSLDLKIENLDIPFYLNYLPNKRDFGLRSGLMTADAAFFFLQNPDEKPIIGVNGSIDLHDIKIVDFKENALLWLPDINIAVKSSDIFRKSIHMAKISCTSPQVSIQKDQNGEINLLSLINNKQEKDAATKTNKKAADVSLDVDEIEITDGIVLWKDLTPGAYFQTTLYPLSVNVKDFSNTGNRKSLYSITTQTEISESVELNGHFVLSPLSIEGKAGIRGFMLPKYAPYYKDILSAQLKSGEASLLGGYIYSPGKEGNGNAIFSGINLNIDSLVLMEKDKRDELMNIPYLEVKDASVNLFDREIVVGDLITRKGDVSVKRMENKMVNLQEIVHFRALPEKGGQKTPSKEKPWTVSLKRIAAGQYTIGFEDLAVKEPVFLKIDQLELSADGISTRKDSKGTISILFRFNKKGTA